MGAAMGIVTRAALCFAVILSLATPSSVSALDGEGLMALKSAGITDDTIAMLVRHRCIETGQWTVAEMVALKQAGIGDATLLQMIESGSFLRDRADKFYGDEGHGVRFLTVADLIRLKTAGIGDATLQALIRDAGPGQEDVEARQAWDMLETMGIVVDRRRRTGPWAGDGAR